MIEAFTFFALWILRLRISGRAALKDALGLCVVLVFRHRKAILSSWQQAVTFPMATTLTTITAAVFVTALCSWVANRKFCLAADGNDDHPRNRLQPMIFPCRTTHSRFYPQVHSFAYTYLYVGIPVGWSGRAGTLLSAENVRSRRRLRSWFSVEAEDYLARGLHPDGLVGKLQDYLRAQNVDAGKYPQAYLVTAPRFLGYSFNPVSFWYLYDDKEALSAMILEVNNTFDERRMYLLQHDRTVEEDASFSANALTFSQAWPKDFHVSPFNDRQGFYSLNASDPYTSNIAKVDNNVTLRSTEGRPKLVARVFSTANPVLPKSLSTFASLKFVLAWWWVGLTTDIRILREARKLWMKGLQVFYRPEVFVSSIGRRAAVEEEVLEKQFRVWLKTAVNAFPEKIRIVYTAAINTFSEELFSNVHPDSDASTTIHLKVLSPAFYRGLVYSPSAVDLFDNVYFKAAGAGRLLSTSNDVILKQLLDRAPRCAPLPDMEDGSWTALRLLHHSLLSAIIRQTHVSPEHAKAALKIWTSDKAFFGSLTLLNAIITMLWLGWLYVNVRAFERPILISLHIAMQS